MNIYIYIYIYIHRRVGEGHRPSTGNWGLFGCGAMRCDANEGKKEKNPQKEKKRTKCDAKLFVPVRRGEILLAGVSNGL